MISSIENIKAQTPADWWYFGDSAGIHFTSSGPVSDTNGKVQTSEGVATISDQNGDLLFYTDGIQVYNANHIQMPNGDSLMGNGSSTQSAIIVPWPFDPDKYFVFTVQQLGGPEGLRYSLVDLTLDGGLGDVVSTIKNIPLHTPVREKVAAIAKANGSGYWVVSRSETSDSIFVYEITSTGLNLTPQTFEIGNTVSTFGGTVGYLKFSASGDLLASANYSDASFELFKFNTLTGEVSDPLEIPTTYSPYGIEFSPNESFVYSGGIFGSIYQYELANWSVDSIVSSELEVGISAGANFGALALGPDSKIYIARNGANFLGRIDDPDQAGMACTFIDTALMLKEEFADLVCLLLFLPFLKMISMCLSFALEQILSLLRILQGLILFHGTSVIQLLVSIILPRCSNQIISIPIQDLLRSP